MRRGAKNSCVAARCDDESRIKIITQEILDGLGFKGGPTNFCLRGASKSIGGNLAIADVTSGFSWYDEERIGVRTNRHLRRAEAVVLPFFHLQEHKYR